MRSLVCVFCVFGALFSVVLSTPIRITSDGDENVPYDWGNVNDDCSNFNGENGCVGQQTDQFPEFANRGFQTPPRGSPAWQKEYQDYSHIQGFADVKYDSERKSAVVTVETVLKYNNSLPLSFSFNGAKQSSNVFKVDASLTTALSIQVTTADGKVLVLDDVDLVWNNPAVNQGSEYENGQKGAIIELFGWPYKDIEDECAAIGKMGYLGVKVFPPMGSIMSYDWLQNGELNPWWFLYQPTSYRLYSRMGTRDELRSMIVTCRKNGVRVYADAVTNHMTGGGNDVGSHRNGNGGGCAYWGPKESSDHSPYFTQDFNYEMNNFTGRHPALEYPAVPYGPEDFHCERPLNSWSSPFDLNYGWLVGLSDLNTERANVQDRIAAYMTDLLGIGFSGFRMDAAKHIQPDDLTAILGKFRTNMGGSFPDDFITYLEVLIGGEKELLECDYSSYNYATYFTDAMKKAGFSDDDVAKVKIWESDYPKEFPICGSWVIPSTRFAIENDCHDDQNPGSSSRDMGDKGSVLVLEKNVPKHRGFEVELFTRTDGDWKIRLVLSSYTFMDTGAMGFPDGESDCSKCVGEDRCKGCKSMAYSKAHDPTVCGYTCLSDSGQWLQGVYTRVHRDKSIIMAMRKWMGLSLNVSNADLGLPDQCQEE